MEPGEVSAPPADPHFFDRVRLDDAIQEPYRLPAEVLSGIKPAIEGVSELLECPLIVFINSRSGGRDGFNLALQLNRAIGKAQVFDLSTHRPDRVLARMWENLRVMEAGGHARARILRSKLRILVAGGDGTIAWVLKTIKDLDLKPAPPVAIMPLGTGNDLSRSFGWGGAFDHNWISNFNSLFYTLKRVNAAAVADLDCWRVTVTLPRKELLKDHPHSLSLIPPTQPCPYDTATLHAAPPSSTLRHPPQARSPICFCVCVTPRSTAEVTQEKRITAGLVSLWRHGSAVRIGGSAATAITCNTAVSCTTAATTAAIAGTPAHTEAPSVASEDASCALQGMFWNYLSVGLDAKAAHNFHKLREHKPYLTINRATNQFWYSAFSCTSGWFCCTKPLNTKVKLLVQTPGSDSWEELPLSDSIRAVVVLNLQSYAGGRNLWGKDEGNGKGFGKSSCEDGLLEVVGLTNGYHTAAVMATRGDPIHAQRLCHASGIRMQLQAAYVRADGEPSHCYCQIDGEPWVQNVPSGRDDRPVQVEIVHAGTSKVLKNAVPLAGQHSLTTSQTLVRIPTMVKPGKPPALAPAPPSVTAMVTAGGLTGDPFTRPMGDPNVVNAKTSIGSHGRNDVSPPASSPRAEDAPGSSDNGDSGDSGSGDSDSDSDSGSGSGDSGSGDSSGDSDDSDSGDSGSGDNGSGSSGSHRRTLPRAALPAFVLQQQQQQRSQSACESVC
ncbi:MAG: hypothetical protein WDW38_001832 [Sanguina aurantia]